MLLRAGRQTTALARNLYRSPVEFVCPLYFSQRVADPIFTRFFELVVYGGVKGKPMFDAYFIVQKDIDDGREQDIQANRFLE